MSMAEERVIKIGMLGLGTVGTGVYKVLKSQQEEMLPKLGARVELKKILVRNVEKAAAKVDDPSIITTSFEESQRQLQNSWFHWQTVSGQEIL